MSDRRISWQIREINSIAPSAAAPLSAGWQVFLAGSPLLAYQQDPFRDHSRVPALGEMVDAFDFEPVAFAKLPRQSYDYPVLWRDGEFTLRRNREAFDWVELVPRIPGDVRHGQPRVHPSRHETAVSDVPRAPSRQIGFHPEAEAATHAGATAASNTPMIVSNAASLPVEKDRGGGHRPLVVPALSSARTRITTGKTLDEALAAGCRAIVVTVDQQASFYERSQHDRNLASSATPVPMPSLLRRGRALPATPIASPMAGSGTNGSCSTNSAPWSRFR